MIPVRVRILLFISLLLPSPVLAKTVVFWQPGFPTIASAPIAQATLTQALDGLDPSFADIAALNTPATLADADLLVLPYGSAVPTDAWKAILAYIQAGGNLLIAGGQPLRVPVTMKDGSYQPDRPQDSYSGVLGMHHTYAIRVPGDASFAWRSGYADGPPLKIRAQRFFAVEGRLNGLGYMSDSTGLLVAAPVIYADHSAFADHGRNETALRGRMVALDFEPMPEYWASADGVALMHRAADYAAQGATLFSVETLFSLLRPGEMPQISVHLEHAHTNQLVEGEVKVELLSGDGVLDSAVLSVPADAMADIPVPFHKPLTPGFYRVRASYCQHSRLREFYENGFWVSEPDALRAGPALGVHADFLTKDQSPFFPVGTNYFSTEQNGWDFSGPRNAAVWETDFSEMESHGVSFVRTGVWSPNSRFIDGDLGEANERFLRNLEAYLLSAQRHHIAVNFTFFAFSPRSGGLRTVEDDGASPPPPNPYLDPQAIHAEEAYVRSVVERFKGVPWLCWDLINEPSFSNPRHVFKGNYPNGDPVELAAWRKWLRQRYGTLDALARAWAVTPEQLASFDYLPLPAVADLTYRRYSYQMEVRAIDYNLFAQEMFADWVRTMVATIHATGSKQLIDVGQDEGGVTDRVLNQFYAGAGVSFTTNHTYWEDDSLLWDSVVAKVPGMPNITGETGYQPAWEPDGAWRYDELTGLGLTERKWALGFAAGSSGAMQWDWAREVDFGMQRSDGSAKLWENMMRDLGKFAREAAPFAEGLIEPDVAIVLPQSYQMSVSNLLARQAQQTAVRALYNYAHSQAYAVGEYQIQLLGSPKLILLPSAYGLSEAAWQGIEERVRAGAVLLVTGPFGEDEHFHATGRQDAAGLPYTLAPLTQRENLLHFPGGEEALTYSGMMTTTVGRAVLHDDEDWLDRLFGKGKILFATLPLELNDNVRSVADVYRYALKAAHVPPVYSTTNKDPGILICPTRFPRATLYVLVSESNQGEVSFQDLRSGKEFSGTLPSGRAALLLVGLDGKLLATYNWPAK
jgi:Beta-galactosidase